METEDRSLHAPWYQRYEKIIQWITILLMLCGGVLHYFLVDLPSVRAIDDSRKLTQQMVAESKRNQKLIDQKLIEAQANTAVLGVTPEQIRVQTQLSKANIEQLDNPTKKASDRLALEQQHLTQVKLVDELVESLRPNMQIKLLPKVHWKEDVIVFTFTITNAGNRPIVVDSPSISVDMKPRSDLSGTQSNNNSWPPKAEIEICGGGFINAKDEFTCAVHFRATPSTEEIRSLTYSAQFTARSEVHKNSETRKILNAVYSDKYIEPKLKYTMRMRGDILR